MPSFVKLVQQGINYFAQGHITVRTELAIL